jgi:hypothetical protein
MISMVDIVLYFGIIVLLAVIFLNDEWGDD